MMMSLSVTAFAATNDGTENTTIDVNAMYTGGISSPDVISVTVEWGDMQFTYSESGSMDWDAPKHEYVDNTTAG